MGSCSILAIKNNDLFHIKITHIENCFCSVERSLPLAKKAESLAWPLAWLAILTTQNSLPNLWSCVWFTRTFRFSFCTSSHQLICSDHHQVPLSTEPVWLQSLLDYWAWLLEPDCLSLTTWAWLLEPDYLSLTTWAWLLEPDYPDYLSLTTGAWLLEPDYPDYLSLTTEPDYPDYLSLTTWQPSGSCWQHDWRLPHKNGNMWRSAESFCLFSTIYWARQYSNGRQWWHEWRTDTWCSAIPTIHT